MYRAYLYARRAIGRWWSEAKPNGTPAYALTAPNGAFTGHPKVNNKKGAPYCGTRLYSQLLLYINRCLVG